MSAAMSVQSVIEDVRQRWRTLSRFELAGRLGVALAVLWGVTRIGAALAASHSLVLLASAGLAVGSTAGVVWWIVRTRRRPLEIALWRG